MIQKYVLASLTILTMEIISHTTRAEKVLGISALDAIKFHKNETTSISTLPKFNLTDIRNISRTQDGAPEMEKPFKMHFKAPQNYEVDRWEWTTPGPHPKHYRLVGKTLYGICKDPERSGRKFHDIGKDNSFDNVIPLNKFDVDVKNKMEFCLTIKELGADDFGKWVFKVFYKNDPKNQFQVIIKTITSDIRKEPDFRLPTHIKPYHYNIWLTPFILEGNWTTKGRVEINVENVLTNGGVDNITLHAEDMAIMDVSVKQLADNSSIKIKGYGYDPERDFFIIYFRSSIQNKFTISIDFLSNLNDDMKGFYRSSYQNVTSKKRVFLATTQFQASELRKALPCFDEPNMKATFQTNLGRTKNMTSLSNMDKISQGTPMIADDEYVWDKYNTTPIMSCYLLVFIVCDFDHVKSQNSLKPFNIWARKDKLDWATYAARISPQLLNYFEDYFNISDPLPKQEKIAIPDFASGAMENWGLNTYRETILLYHPNISTIDSKKRTATVIAHELSHIWYGNLVTCEWWNE